MSNTFFKEGAMSENYYVGKRMFESLVKLYISQTEIIVAIFIWNTVPVP